VRSGRASTGDGWDGERGKRHDKQDAEAHDSS
jgi:hypothetical protein